MADPTSDGVLKIDAMKSAVSGFLQRFNLTPSNPTTSDHIAVVAFDDSSYLIQNLTSNFSDIQTSITTLQTGGGTNIANGIREATNILNGPDANHVGNAVPVLILLSDGVSDDIEAVIDEAERARRTLSSDFQLVSIAFGPPDEVDFDTLRTISNRVYDTDSATQLNVLYDQVATLIQPQIAARQMTIRYQVDGSRFTAVADSANPPATFDSASQTFTWVYDELKTGQTAEFIFEAQSNVVSNPIDVGAISAEYLPCVDTTPIVDTATGPLMQLLPPTPTPTFTPTATATNTPTPTVTPTATPNSILRNDPMLPPTQQGVNLGFCVGGANNWISWLILALLLALALWIIFWLFRRLPPRSVRHWRDVSCLLLQILTLLALVFLLWGLLNPLVGLLCPKPESIYFWRMSGGERGIFLTHENLQQDAPAQVSSLNQSCVGCHTVDDQNGRLAAIAGLGNLAIVNFNGEPVTTPPIDAIYADFSPDGNKLAVSTGDADLYIIDLITQTSQQLTQASDGTYGAIMPNWHPNGQDIAFVRAPKSNIEYGLAIVGSSDIYTVSATDGAISPVDGASNNERLNYYPNYSPDGRWLSVTSHAGTTTYSDPSADIWLVDTTNGNARSLSVNDPSASDSWAVWNRDGDTLAFNTTRYDQSFDIMLVDIDPLTGVDSNARLLAGASEPGVFEHLPFWGRPIAQESILVQWGRLWPWWFIPFLMLLPLMLLCMLLPKPKKQLPTPPPPPPDIPLPPMGEPAARVLLPITPLWKPRTTLVIGVGDAGWYILTQLKKTLYDAGIGKLPQNVRLLSIIAGTEERLLNNVGVGLPLVEGERIQLKDNIASLLEDNPRQDASLRHWLQATQIRGTVGDNISPENGLQDERIFGRMAYIANQRGIHHRTGFNIHDQIVQSAREILGNTAQGQVLSVVIVAELGDALASGSFMDLALLGKRLKEELGLNELYQVGHLLTTHANEGMPTDKKKVNTAAALRELIRAELTAARGDMTFPFIYDTEFHSSRNVIWKNSLLFNELYLYDG
ncbi:MAG: VWA domain-containing protein, partial [Phototrophicaceae bacterium]